MIQTASTLTGAVPVTYATLLLMVTVGLTVKLVALHRGQLRGDAALRLGEPGSMARGGIFDTQAIGGERIVFGHEQRPAVGDIERPVDQFLQRPPVHAQENRRVVDVRHIGVLRVER